METVCEHCNKITKVTKIKKSPEKSLDAKEVIQFYIELFKEKFNSEPEINWAACVLATNKMFKSKTKDELKSLIPEYLKSEAYYKQSGYRYLMFPAWLQARVVNEVKEQVCNVKKDYKHTNARVWDGLL